MIWNCRLLQNFEPYMKTVAINDYYSWSLNAHEIKYVYAVFENLTLWLNIWIEQTNNEKDDRLTANGTLAGLLRIWMIILTFLICFSPTMKWNEINSNNAHTINKIKKTSTWQNFSKIYVHLRNTGEFSMSLLAFFKKDSTIIIIYKICCMWRSGAKTTLQLASKPPL